MLDIYPAREKQEDFKDITSQMIIDLLNNGEHIDESTSSKLYQHKDNVILFMSPKEITKIKKDVISHFESELK